MEKTISKDNIQWKRMCFKGNKVWVAVDPNGNFITRNGRVLMKYQIDQDYEYRVYERDLQPLDDTSEKRPPEIPSPKSTATGRPPEPRLDQEDSSRNVIRVYTDGASSGNPGPAGIGIVLRYGEYEKEISRYIGISTNNIAELEAIRTALMEIKKTELPVRVYTDSGYAFGLLALGWRPQKNQALVNTIKQRIAEFKDIKFIKVRGHAGHEENERADRLATSAIKTRKGSDQ